MLQTFSLNAMACSHGSHSLSQLLIIRYNPLILLVQISICRLDLLDVGDG